MPAFDLCFLKMKQWDTNTMDRKCFSDTVIATIPLYFNSNLFYSYYRIAHCFSVAQTWSHTTTPHPHPAKNTEQCCSSKFRSQGEPVSKQECQECIEETLKSEGEKSDQVSEGRSMTGGEQIYEQPGPEADFGKYSVEPHTPLFDLHQQCWGQSHKCNKCLVVCFLFGQNSLQILEFSFKD